MRIAAAILLCASCAAPRAYMPLTGGGPFLNVGQGDQALTNASAHVGWSLAVGALGYALDGRQGLRIACGAWGASSVVGEAFFHAPPLADPSYPSEVRTDLLTKLIPCGLLVLAEALVR